MRSKVRGGLRKPVSGMGVAVGARAEGIDGRQRSSPDPTLGIVRDGAGQAACNSPWLEDTRTSDPQPECNTPRVGPRPAHPECNTPRVGPGPDPSKNKPMVGGRVATTVVMVASVASRIMFWAKEGWSAQSCIQRVLCSHLVCFCHRFGCKVQRRLAHHLSDSQRRAFSSGDEQSVLTVMTTYVVLDYTLCALFTPFTL